MLFDNQYHRTIFLNGVGQFFSELFVKDNGRRIKTLQSIDDDIRHTRSDRESSHYSKGQMS